MSASLRRLYDVRLNGTIGNPLIGQLSVPVRRDSLSGTPSKTHRKTENSVLVESVLPLCPIFSYSDAWLRDGYSLGSDLPLTPGLHTPAAGRQLFCCLEERALPARLLPVFAGGPRPDPRVVPEASDLENLALNIPGKIAANGALLLLPAGASPNARLHAVPVPAGSHLAELIYAHHAQERGRAKDDDLALLRQALTLPGQRARLSVVLDRETRAVQLRSLDDAVDTPLWSAIALSAAKKCGICTVGWKLERQMGETLMIAERPDRLPADAQTARTEPVMMLSAATLAAAPRSPRAGGRAPAGLHCLAVADILNREGAKPAEDLPELWSRMVFALLSGCTDILGAELQFIREPLGWRLAPAQWFDWTPPGFAPSARNRLTADGRKPLETPEQAVAVAPYFGLTVSEAKTRLMGIIRVLADWDSLALDLGADPGDISRVSPRFELI